ncbi:undecaprenyl-diphosphate phosphatase [Aurantibacillus circumpalustris]|uniref:undecaprenyl-diphosphate phosphatase n=1 Tax=Aurantibacillus circumpalustris TaxID=3036359 RepID=UPI00295AC7DE|nr:undecaprenyl-diphosphate phosphatase [Aurantibacillus circumpalustris]
MTYLQAFIIAIIEGLTEFLPVSSTGHMILADSLLKIQNQEFAKTFEIVIQLGAILAVLLIYIKRFFVGINIYIKLFVAFLPTGIIGLLAYKTIKHYLFNPFTVSIALIVGGVILILLDKWSENKKSEYKNVEDISFTGALKIGFIQCFSMIPGVSRAAATIFGGIFSGFDRKQAAEFSFLLAIPTMFAASGYDLLKEKDNIHFEDLKLMAFGGLIAFIVAIFAVKGFIAFLNKYGFKHFGWYRIALGIVFLSYAMYVGLEISA